MIGDVVTYEKNLPSDPYTIDAQLFAQRTTRFRKSYAPLAWPGWGAKVSQLIDKYGIVVSCHDLRRSFITVAESTDISPLALKALVNHAVGGDVTSNYVRLTVERLREPAQRVADRLKQLCGIAEPAGENVARIGDRA